MANASLKEKLKQETREAIIQAGIADFSSLGYHGLKIAAVARAAGVANGTFYLYFKDKKALYEEIVQRAVSKLGAALFAAHNFKGNKSDTTRAELEAVLDFAERDTDLMRITLDKNVPQLKQGTDLFLPLIELRTKELQQGIKEGHINPGIHPEIGARAELEMTFGIVQWWLNNRGAATREQLLDTLSHIRRAWSVVDSNVEDIDALLSQWDSRL